MNCIYLFIQIGLKMRQSFIILQDDANLTRTDHHVTGMLIHGPKKAYAFTWTNKFYPGTNIPIDVSEVSYVLVWLKSRSLVKRQLYAVMFLHEFIRYQNRPFYQNNICFSQFDFYIIIQTMKRINTSFPYFHLIFYVE